VDRGEAFWCTYKAALFVQACCAAGLNARMLNINRRDADGHDVAEVYSNPTLTVSHGFWHNIPL
jgi:hypothetical protein